MEDLLRLLPGEIPRLDLRVLVDILIVGSLIYGLLIMIKDTTAVTLVRGLAMLILGGAAVSSLFNLPMLGWLVKNSIPALLVAIPILFQPELRRALEKIGGAGGLLGQGVPVSNQAQLIEVIADAARRMAERRWGALIVLERQAALGEYASTGVELDALLTVDLLEQIFHPNTRLHDGAAIVRGERLLAAGCLLPLAESLAAGELLGTRHRAALGMTEQTDAIVIVISEESGQISIANNGRLVRNLDKAKLRTILSILYRPVFPDDFSRLFRQGRPAADRPEAEAGAGTRMGGLLAPLGFALGLVLSRLGEWLGRGTGAR
jgi:diadenylate cyclase